MLTNLSLVLIIFTHDVSHSHYFENRRNSFSWKPHVSTTCGSGGVNSSQIFRKKSKAAILDFQKKCENNIIWVCTPGGILVQNFKEIELLRKIGNYYVIAAILDFFETETSLNHSVPLFVPTHGYQISSRSDHFWKS